MTSNDTAGTAYSCGITSPGCARTRSPSPTPWILLAAIAGATTRIRLGHLSQGRLTLGVGLGSPIEDEFLAVGEPGDPKVLAQRLDESLTILDAAWTGQALRRG